MKSFIAAVTDQHSNSFFPMILMHFSQFAGSLEHGFYYLGFNIHAVFTFGLYKLRINNWTTFYSRDKTWQENLSISVLSATMAPATVFANPSAKLMTTSENCIVL